MSMTHEQNVLKSQNLESVFADLQRCVQTAAAEGWTMHQIDREGWRHLLQMGRAALGQFLTQVGTGDVGETLTLSDGQECRRLPATHPRRYVSIFGVFRIARVVYGSREGQKIECVPLDNRLQLPESDFSYLLQDWDQSLCVEQAFGQARTTVARMLGLTQSADSLEHMNQEMAELATTFMLHQPTPTEGSWARLALTPAGAAVHSEEQVRWHKYPNRVRELEQLWTRRMNEFHELAVEK